MNATIQPQQQSQTKPVAVPENGGTVLRAFGDQMTVKLAAEQTQSALSLLVDVIPPGGGPPPHYHLNEDELFILHEGRVSYFVNGQWTALGPGGVVFAPRGHVHTFRNVGDRLARQSVLTTPSGFETFFARCAAEFAKPGGPDQARIVAISAEHGIHYLEPTSIPPTPENLRGTGQA
jgi:quercetin dioxygenase-like cupin family protein